MSSAIHTATPDNTQANYSAPTWGFYLCLLLLLGLGLGTPALTGSENRWADIARNMVENGDAFHPIINGVIYFDKPLGSYWLVVVASWFTGNIDELAARLPSVLAALLVLWSTFYLARQLWNRQIAWLSLWLTMTCYGFLFWARTASADLINVGFTVLAVAWFIQHRDKTNLLSYATFHVICAVGSQMKGLTAWVVPCVMIAPYIVRDNRWRTHLNVSHVIGGLIGLAVFAVPYLLSALAPLPPHVALPEHGLSGVGLLIRENFVRFVAPFDHKDPIYSYLYQIPRILFPWSLLFIGSFIYFIRHYRQLAVENKWLLESIVLVFLFFTLSGSRRWYYILPILPLCMIQIAVFFHTEGANRLRTVISVLTAIILLLLALALLALPGVAIAMNMTVPAGFWLTSILTLLGCGFIAAMHYRGSIVFPTKAVAGYMSPTPLLSGVLLMALVFAVVLPTFDQFREEKPFSMRLAARLGLQGHVAFYQHTNETVVFYLHHHDTVPVVKTADEFLSLWNDNRSTIFVTTKEHEQSFLTLIPPSLTGTIVDAYALQPWDNNESDSDLVAYQFTE